jgi:O-antigen/teichoic acid export membrane protein
MNYKKKAIKGLVWTFSLSGVTRVVVIIKLGILARMLNPSDFGSFAIALLTLSLIEILTETGINAFLIQEQKAMDKYLDAAWLISIIRGIVISLVILLFSGHIARFFNSEEATALLKLIAIVPLLRGFINPSIIQLQKELMFKKEFMIRSVVYALDALVTISLAIITKSALSFVWGLSASVVLEIIVSWTCLKPRPRLHFDISRILKIIKMGRWVTLSGIFNYLFIELDDIVVGKILNTYSLGLYQMAYKVGTLPNKELGGSIAKVTFPIYAKIRHDRDRLKSAFLKVVYFSLIITIPIFIFLFTYTSEIVAILLGSKWTGIVAVLRILLVFGTIRMFSALCTALFLSLRKQKYNSIVTFAGLTGIFITLVPLVQLYGTLGAALSVTLGSVIELLMILYFLQKEFD